MPTREMNRRKAPCARCGKVRPIISYDMCNPCAVRHRYDLRDEIRCPRCEQMRKPFVGELCKSCYQTTRYRPGATRRGTPEHSKRLSEATTGRQVGTKSPKWKGGRMTQKDGYVRVLVKSGKANESDRYALEHRVVAEQKIGRPLHAGEVVHHINGVRDDNRPENLEVLTSVAEHRKLHVKKEAAMRAAGVAPQRAPRRARAKKPAPEQGA